MIQPTQAKQRILVIEDIRLNREDVIRCFRRISEKTRWHYGISSFEIDEAASVSEAEQHLKAAVSRPYDLVMLDLHLPDNKPGDGTESLDNGHNLLKFIKESQTAKGIIVVSGIAEYENVIGSFKGGALDFVKKPFFQEDIQPSVLNALARLMAAESERILSQRVHDIVAYAEIGLAHSFKLIFNKLLDNVTEAADEVEKYVRERYGLDREKDPYDSLMLKLQGHQKAVAQARRDWAGLQAELSSGGNQVKAGNAGQMLRDVKESLLPCLVVKKVALDPPDCDEREVMTFEKDVEVVMREIIAGALSEMPDYGEDRQIKISFTIEDTRAKVRFEDNLDPIPEEKKRAINEGQRIIPDANFGRVWGLSVAQHVALRGGGELKVKTERGRNVVTYYIP